MLCMFPVDRHFTLVKQTKFTLVVGTAMTHINRTCFTVQEYIFFWTRNEYYIILSFVFYAFICWWANTVRVYILILYVNSTTEETWWSLQIGVGEKNVHICTVSTKRVVKCWLEIQDHASLLDSTSLQPMSPFLFYKLCKYKCFD